jgi:hypothetical protein
MNRNFRKTEAAFSISSGVFKPCGGLQSMKNTSITLLCAALVGSIGAMPSPSHAQAPTVKVFASGLENPRGLRFSPEGVLYVAEAGLGGSLSTTPEQCQQVPFPIGPYTGGYTSRISKFASDGTRTTVAEGIPSNETNPLSGGFLSGVADLAFIGNRLFALTAGSGCSHGLLNTVNGVFRVEKNGTLSEVADLSGYQQTHPVAQPNADDFEPDGTWFSMVRDGDAMYAIEPNHGELDKITASGEISRISDISASQGHIVPTSVVMHDGDFYFGNLGLFPIVPGSSNVYKLNPRTGEISVFASGFSTVEGIDFDSKGNLYVLESMTNAGFPMPSEAGSGTIVRVNRSGGREPVLTGLSFPTAMIFGPDGKLYVSNLGYAAPPGVGEIWQIELK